MISIAENITHEFKHIAIENENSETKCIDVIKCQYVKLMKSSLYKFFIYSEKSETRTVLKKYYKTVKYF